MSNDRKLPNISRRTMLRGSALAALATGLPAGFLENPLSYALEPTVEPQFLLLACSDRGDPLNVNCPGSYEHAGIDHPDGSPFVETPIPLGGTMSSAAEVWRRLPDWVLERSCFIHHATKNAVHSDMPKVLRLDDSTRNHEMLPSLIAAQQSAALQTIQDVPVNLGRYVTLSAGGLALPRIRPTALKELLTAADSPLADLRSIRDRRMDEIHAILKRDGTPEQLRYLDDRARSRENARQLADGAASLLGDVTDDTPQGELLAALALFKLRVTPVVTTSVLFGGDNHSDAGLQEETDQHIEGIEAIGNLMNALQSEGLEDAVTFAILNVFGRNLISDPNGGRDHWAKHAVSVVIGSGVRAGVVGGLAPDGDDFTSLGIDSATGAAMADGADISFDESLASVGKTIWAATGTECETIDEEIQSGKVITAALT